MLGDGNAIATIAVKDVKAARRFYEGVLGLEPVPSEGPPQVILYKSGSSQLLVYESSYAGTNKATSVTWIVGDDLEGLVKELRSKGVAFEHYDFPGVSLQGDVHVMGKRKNAWLKDPDGNILSLVNR
jgi:catechol 2,3-dioxygenase-like lactoylglutathione lyase family enzyme